MGTYSGVTRDCDPDQDVIIMIKVTSLTSDYCWMSMVLSVKVDLALLQARLCKTLVATNLRKNYM